MTRTPYRYLLIAFLGLGLLNSCSKNDDVVPDEPIETGEKVPFYTVQRVENLAVENDDSNPTADQVEVFYSLEYKKQQTAAHAKTDLWDISFSGLFNSFVGANNKTNAGNSGYGGKGLGGILIVEKPFDEVINIPADSEFKTGKGIIGTDDMGEFGEGIGWYIYDFYGNIVGDGSEQKKHVSYALGNQLTLASGEEAPIRTIIVRTATGNYAKIKMISCYKDAFTADKMLKDTPHMYFTFEYVMVPAGSKTFSDK